MKDQKFTTEELSRIDQADDLKISPFREDGQTYGTPTWIWEVVVDGELYARAYNGTGSRWYRSAISQKAGRIHTAGMVKEVTFELIDDAAINYKIDTAYQQKYSKSPYMAHMISSKAKAATVKIISKNESL
ncbi:MAG: DUF2255 family protein [Mucilaginibacter sp.]|nr:DUF2255 family protein [Mucilaginibacter sp.]